MISRYLKPLRPSPAAVRGLAMRETDPARCREFEPIAWGFAGNCLLLLFICLAGAVAAPVRLLAALVRKR